MWKLTPTKSYEIRQKRYQKKHKRELAAVLNNLDTLLKAFQAGLKPLQATTAFGFVHPEPNAVVSIDQKGGGLNLAQTRLYAYPDEEKGGAIPNNAWRQAFTSRRYQVLRLVY